MRSSKSRSRSKQNRPRTLGNVINRVFDSSGPEGKVRGTPQQIIEKYQILARDAQLSNDRVAAENFMQHAEHYTRLLAEAQREMQAEQEARQQNWQPNGNQNGGNQNGGNQNGGQNRDRDQNRDQGRDQNREQGRDNRETRGEQRPDNRTDNRADSRDRDQQPRHTPRQDEPAPPMGVEVIDLSGDDDAGLVDTPEAGGGYSVPVTAAPEPDVTVHEPAAVAAPEAEAGEQPRPAQNRLRAPRGERSRRAPATEGAAEAGPAEAEAKPARSPRKPRKPRAEAAEATGNDSAQPEGGPREAAE